MVQHIQRERLLLGLVDLTTVSVSPTSDYRFDSVW